MLTVQSVADLRAAVKAWRSQGETIAFVPTMGNLHAGHIRLVEAAREEAARVVVSIFVNPTQFGPGEDFAAYPRTPEEDSAKLEAAATDLLFLPEVETLYPSKGRPLAYVEVPGISEELCGAFRPGHFRGVATVVLKLFNLVQPDVALFGEKDFQQLMVIRRMVADLDVPVQIIGVPTVREANGLAMSSRNAYLSPAEREHAARLQAALNAAAAEIRQGRRDFAAIGREWEQSLAAEGFQPDYFAIRRLDDLAEPAPDETRLVLLVAARLGRARLIDNLKLVF
jgi:pantoate--beta-alanine ligase